MTNNRLVSAAFKNSQKYLFQRDESWAKAKQFKCIFIV